MPTGETLREPPRTIAVSGTGRIQVRPDLADLRLGVTITAPTVAEARAQSAEVMQAVLASLRDLGIADADLRTSIVSVSPQYDYSGNTGVPRLIGYQFQNLVAAVLRDVEQTGDAIDRALTAGATNVDHLAFRVADPSDAQRRARESAVADARAKAATLAAAAGVEIAGVQSILESGAPVPYPMPAMELAAFKARDASTPVEAGEQEVVADVAMVFLIE